VPCLEESLVLSLDQFREGGVTYLIRCTLYPGTPDEIGGRMVVTAPLERISRRSRRWNSAARIVGVRAGGRAGVADLPGGQRGNVPLTDLG
jgi:hypothetical protein